MPARVLELGLVGFGRLARKYYVPALRALTGVRVSVVVDPLEPSLVAARNAFPEAVTAANEHALLSQHLDGLIVASPPSTHLALWNLAARAGLPVFLEKPFALHGELAQAATGQRERKLLMLDLNRRFWPPYRRIRESVKAGLLGNLRSLEILLHVDIRPWCSVTSHRLEPGEGGVLFDLGSQAIDLARWIAGSEPRQVSVFSESRRWEDDHVLVQLEFKDGLQAHCSLAYTTHTTERILVIGERGEMWLRNPNMSVRFKGPGKRYVSPLSLADLAAFCYRALRRSHSMMRYSVTAALAAFIQSIRSGLPFHPGFDEALANARWLDAAASAMEPVSAGIPTLLPHRSTTHG